MFIGVPKGELAKETMNYLKKEYDIDIPINGRLYTIEKNGNIYRICNSRDVPRFTGTNFNFGITGKDNAEDEKFSGNRSFDYIKDLGFSKGSIVFFGTGKKVPRSPKIVTSAYYPNLAYEYGKKIFGGEPEILIVRGATEGYVPSLADVSLDSKFSGKTSRMNGLVELEEVMKTSAVLIGRKDLTMEGFEKALKRK